MRRGILSGSVVSLCRAVNREFELFRYQMLSKSREEIFQSCNVIRFYSCIYEYFSYKEKIAKAHVKACLKCENVIAALYQLYLKYEYLRYSQWEDIEEILNVLVREQEEMIGSVVLQK